MPTCSECGFAVVQFVLKEIDKNRLVLPTEISLTLLSKETGFSPQLIGMAFDDYIKKAINANDFDIRKAGKPTRFQISKS